MAVEKTRLTSIPKHARHRKHFILIIIAIGLWFYWFQWRPSQIVKNCYKEIEDMPGTIETLYGGDYRCREGAGCVKRETLYDKLFKACINKHGIK